MNRIEEIRARLAAIQTEMDAEGADTEALLAEARSLTDELQTLRSQENDRREIRGLVASGAGVVTDRPAAQAAEQEHGVGSELYRRAFLRTLMGQPLTVEERAEMSSSTASGGYAIPTETLNRIEENMVQVAPMIGEIDLMHIPSNVTIPVEGTRNAAALHTENAAITPASDTIARVALTGYEIVKLLSISAKLDAMSVPAFEDWIVSNLSRSGAYAVEDYIFNGSGSSQPKGIDAAETWVANTNAVDWASTAPTVAEIEKQIGLLNGAYIGNAKFAMTWTTFWTYVHSLRDDKHPEVCTYENGVYRIFGFPVVFSAYAAAGAIYFGDFFAGVKANFAQDFTVERSAASGFRTNSVDFRNTCIFDCQSVAGRIIKSAASLS